MTSATYTVEFGTTGSTATPLASIHDSGRGSTPLPARASTRIVPLSSIGQAYYWKHTWQAGEHETLRELAAGEARVFDNPVDAIRYLVSTDE